MGSRDLLRRRREWLVESGKLEVFGVELDSRLQSGGENRASWLGAFESMGPPEGLRVADVEYLALGPGGRKVGERLKSGAKVVKAKKPRGKVEAKVAVEDGADVGRRCAYDRGVEWVSENLEREGVRFEDRVSDSAWAMLLWARESQVSKQSFWTQVYSKIAPAKAERELAAMRADDMVADERLVARVLRLCVKAREEAGVR